jgi:predicted transposase YdaD
MIDIAKATEVLDNYFANVTQEQFDNDLRKFCPELFEEENNLNSTESFDSEIDREPQGELKSPPIANAEIYQKAKEDHKLEIAPKLLEKGLSVDEVAEILGVDVSSIDDRIAANSVK